MKKRWARLGELLMLVPPFERAYRFLNSRTLPGFEGLSLWQVIAGFFTGIRKSSISDRAAVMTFKLTMALFPALLFFCTLIPFIPIPRLEALILKSFGNVMPGQFYLLIQEALQSLMKNQSRSLLSLSLLAALYFGSNSILSLMEAMNKSAHIRETRKRWKLRLYALILLLMVFIMTVVAVSLIYGTSEFLKYLRQKKILGFGSIKTILYMLQLVLLYIQLFVTISLIYTVAPARRISKRFFSPGAILAANSSFVASLGLSYFFNNFGQYNKIYGTIGSIPIVLLWIYINSMVLLVGFELNASIRTGSLRRRALNLEQPGLKSEEPG